MLGEDWRAGDHRQGRCIGEGTGHKGSSRGSSMGLAMGNQRRRNTQRLHGLSIARTTLEQGLFFFFAVRRPRMADGADLPRGGADGRQ
jgi:hypothetical protein